MIKINDLNFAERVALEVLWGLTWVFSILPHWVKFHLIEPVFYFLFCHFYTFTTFKCIGQSQATN